MRAVVRSLVAMGTVGDRLGHERILLLGPVAFTAASVIAAFAPARACSSRHGRSRASPPRWHRSRRR